MISNPGPRILNKLFATGSNADASAATLYSGTTSVTANAVSIHAIPKSVKTVCVRNNGGTAILVSSDNGGTTTSVAVGGSLLVTSIPFSSIQVSSTGVRVGYSVLASGQAVELPNPVIVGVSGGDDVDFETVQAAVDASAARYASTGTRQAVDIYPGVDIDVTPDDLDIGTDVVMPHQPGQGRSSGSRIGIHEHPRQYWQCGHPGALVAVVGCDHPNWLTASADYALDGVATLSPAEYIYRCGIPQSHSIINATYADRWTDDQIHEMCYKYASGLGSHSYDHDVAPVAGDVDELAKQIVTAKRKTESLSSATWTDTPELNGVKNNGVPCTYYEPWGATGSPYTLTLPIDRDNTAAMMIRANYESSRTGNIVANNAGQVGAHFRSHISIHNASYGGANPFDAEATAAEYLYSIAYPGARICFRISGPGETATHAQVVNLCKAIVALRDDRTTYPDRAVWPVSERMIVNAVQPPATYVAGVIQIPEAGYGLYETFTNTALWPAEALASGYQRGGVQIGITGASASVTPTVDGDDRFLRLQGGDVGQNARMYVYFNGAPERQYVLAVRMREANNTDNVGVEIKEYYINDAGAVASIATKALINTMRTAGTTWKTVYIPVLLKQWSSGGAIVQIQRFGNAGLTRIMDIDSVALMPV